MPKISVIMSVYNGEEYLREAVESVMNQTPFESWPLQSHSFSSFHIRHPYITVCLDCLEWHLIFLMRYVWLRWQH